MIVVDLGVIGDSVVEKTEAEGQKRGEKSHRGQYLSRNADSEFVDRLDREQ